MSGTLIILGAYVVYTPIAFLLTYFIAWWQAFLIWNVITGYTIFRACWGMIARYRD